MAIGNIEIASERADGDDRRVSDRFWRHDKVSRLWYTLQVNSNADHISYWIDLGFSFLEPSDVAWRFPIAFQIVLCLFILSLIMGLPESPRW